MVLEIHMKLRMTEPDLPEKIFFSPKIEKMDQKWSKTECF